MAVPITTLQPQLVQAFQHIITHGQLSAAYVFAGPAGTGKQALATWIAQRLFCQNLQDGAPCGHCPECQRILSGNHPDVLTLATTTQSIKVADVRALKEEMSKSGVEGANRVFIIPDADKMTPGAANSLLKFYEEPVPGMVIILTTAAKNQLLPTILSRAQVINFPQPARSAVMAQLEAGGATKADAALVAHLTADAQAGSELLATGLSTQRERVVQWLGKVVARDPEAFVLVQTQLLPVAKTPVAAKQIVSLIALAYADAFNRHYAVTDDLAYGEEPVIGQLAKLAARQLTAGLTAALQAQVRLTQNVSFQAAVGALAIQLIS